MKAPGKLNRLFRVPPLTRVRIVLALAIAVFADGLQFLLGPFGWTFADQAIDVGTMVLTGWVIGFHWLLLPTFVMEFIPVLDELPTWTACTIAVMALRKREQRAPPPGPMLKSD
jgi:polyferredoxin